MNSFVFSSEFIKRLITSIILIFCVGGAYLHSVALFTMLLVVIFNIIIVFELPKLIQLSAVLFFFVSLIYPGLPIVALIYLNYKYHSINLLIPLYPFLVAWTADTFGYIFGKSFGVHKVCPNISPGKSWEGLLGSAFGCLILNLVILPYFKIGIFEFLNYPGIFLISVLFTLCAFSGGLLMSFLKRRKGLKDAGDVLPGHGGFLDRFDSVFACVLLTWLLLVL